MQVMRLKIEISDAPGAQPDAAIDCHARVSSAVTHMNPPVSTGYSTAWSRYGTAPLLSPSTPHNGMTSE